MDQQFEKQNIFGIGFPNDAYSEYFSGNSYLNPLTTAFEGKPFFANVTFAPGCRNHWHAHLADKGGGQILLCVAGKGWYRERGKEARLLSPGDVVEVPVGVEHWHGATKDGWFAHVAVEIPGENGRCRWLEAVSDAEYDALPGGEK